MAGSYRKYLASRLWRLKTAAVRKRCKGICERCGRAKMSDTHHLTYERLYNEPLEDLEGQCERCHAFESGKSDFDPLSGCIEDVVTCSGCGVFCSNPQARNGKYEWFCEMCWGVMEERRLAYA